MTLGWFVERYSEGVNGIDLAGVYNSWNAVNPAEGGAGNPLFLLDWGAEYSAPKGGHMATCNPPLVNGACGYCKCKDCVRVGEPFRLYFGCTGTLRNEIEAAEEYARLMAAKLAEQQGG